MDTAQFRDEFRLIVGLGNPGRRYAGNRHNIGFMVLDALARRSGLDFHWPGVNYLAASNLRPDPQLVLLKPLTYMNLSGDAVKRWAVDNGIDDVTSLSPLVVCDDLALPLGTVRLRARGSSGGQNGLASVIECLQRDDFPRLRLGVSGPDDVIPSEHWPDYVLSDFSATETETVQEMIEHSCDALEFWLENGTEQTASRFNRRPPRES